MIAKQPDKINVEFARHRPAIKHGLLNVKNIFLAKVCKLFAIPRLNGLEHKPPA